MLHSTRDEEMESRLRRLESTNKRLIAGTMGLALALAAIVSCGLMDSSKPAIGDTVVTKRIYADTIVLADSIIFASDLGQERVVVTPGRIIMNDVWGRSRMVLVEAGVAFSNDREEPQIVIGTTDDGSVVGILNEDLRAGIGIVATSDGHSALEVYDRDGQDRVNLQATSTGIARQTMYDSGGNLRVLLGCTTPSALGVLGFYNADGTIAGAYARPAVDGDAHSADVTPMSNIAWGTQLTQRVVQDLLRTVSVHRHQ